MLDVDVSVGVGVGVEVGVGVGVGVVGQYTTSKVSHPSLSITLITNSGA